MRKLYVKDQPEGNLRKNVGKKFKARVNRQRTQRANVKKTAPEVAIAEILSNLGIVYKSEFAPDGLVNPVTFHPLYLDFFLPELNAAIEYDGIQHYKPIHGNKQLADYKRRDNIKSLYCRYKGIKLLRIAYTTTEIKAEIINFLNKHCTVTMPLA